MTGSPSPYRAGARRAATIAPAVLVFGASFGLLAQSAGMGTLASVVMSDGTKHTVKGNPRDVAGRFSGAMG